MMGEIMDKKEVMSWLINRTLRFRNSVIVLKNKPQEVGYDIQDLICELRAIADEAELRLKNPNFPSND